jgi:signal transduction histidine kinase
VSWFRRLSLRSRLILIGTAGLAVGLLLGGLLLVAMLHYVLIRSVDGGAHGTAADVASLVQAGAPTDPVPTSGTQYVQVLDPQDRIRAASIGADHLVPLLRGRDLARAKAGQVVVVGGDRVGIVGNLRVVAQPVSNGDTVLVAASDHDVMEAINTVKDALLIAYPLLVGALAVLAWHAVGWTLAPVEALRRGAEEISATQTGRLPVPENDDEVHRLAVTLNDMLGRLESARQRQRTFVADAAHELRSPIASLRTQLEVAEHLREPPSIADLSAEVERLGRLVGDLLLLARADEGDPGLRRRDPVEVVGLLRDVAANYQAARVPVAVAPVGPQWTVGDPAALRRVVDNLVANAVRHATSRVSLVAGRSADRVVVTVADDGPGIPAADRQRVFDRFTRLDDARNRDSGGAGLGLAIVRELVRLHSGTVTLGDASPGLRVALTLPPAPPRDPQPSPPMAASPPPATTSDRP